MDPFGTKEYFSVLIPDGESPQAMSVLRCLGRVKNVRTYVLSKYRWAPIRFSRHTTRFFSNAKGKGDEEWLDTLYETVKQTNADVVLPVGEPAIRLLSEKRGIFSKLTSIVPLPHTDAFDVAADKWLLSEWLNHHEIPCPPTILYRRDSRFDKTLSLLTFPVLIKPTRGEYGQGIEFFDDPSALRSYCKEHTSTGEFIIQSFIRGYDIDCSVLCREGKILACTIQKGFIDGPRRFSPPEGIEFIFDGKTYDIVSEVVEKFNWSGVVNFDLRFDEEDTRVKVIEMNPRFWGTLLGSLCAGVNFPYLSCLAGLQRDLPQVTVRQNRFFQRHVTVKMLIQHFIHGKRADLYFDNSSIQFFFADPLPPLFKFCLAIYHALALKRTRNT